LNTTFDDVYSIYIGRIEDFNLVGEENGGLSLADIQEDLDNKLKVALGRFDNLIETTADFTTKQFNRELTFMEKDILALWMVSEWIKPKVLTEQKISDTLNAKDYENHSPANLLEKLINLKKEVDSEASKWTIKYGYKSYIKKRKSNS
jgi:hypothetical protein